MAKSKQLNFFIMPEDWPEISTFFSEAAVKFVRVPFNRNIISFSHDISIKSEDESYITYLVADKFQEKVFARSQQSRFGINADKSYCIEFNRGGRYPNEMILQRARFYTVFGYYDEDTYVSKNKAFEEWVSEIYRKFKRKFLQKSVHDKDFLMSQKTIKWIELNDAKIDGAGLTAAARRNPRGAQL